MQREKRTGINSSVKAIRFIRKNATKTKNNLKLNN